MLSSNERLHTELQNNNTAKKSSVTVKQHTGHIGYIGTNASVLNSVMKNFQSDLKVKEMVNIVTSNSNKLLDYNVLCKYNLS